ncbi:MAG: nucleoside triphosphate pyrophosphohydrolase [Bacteroidales bacterium]|nr:nucleoside triphosphate pyrophosphohydrolase [Bacteroidales bacterium]
MHTKEEKLEAVGRLLDIMDRLRAECPWNGEQTHDSLRQLTLEEVFELSDAVLSRNDSDTEKELGDLLLHIVFYAKIAEEKGLYDIADIATRECEKMIFRHPHVFAGGGRTDAKTVSEQWELRKLKEREGKHILDGVPESAPSVLKAMQIQRKVRDVGFDWESRPDVWAKVREEIAEFEAEARKLDEGDSATAHERAEEELGDVMFALINAARLYDIDPEVALSRTCRKFRRRFDYLEDRTIRSGRLLHSMSLPEMDEIWEEAKSKGL